MEKSKDSKKQFITSDGVRLFYDLKGEGTTLVFLHGWSGSSQDFSGPARRLAKKHRTLIYDQRGHGLSGRPPNNYNLQRLAQDLFELISELGLKRVILIGHSMGGGVTLEYLRVFGQELLAGIILVDVVPKLLKDESWDLGLYKGNYKEEDLKSDILLMKEDFNLFYFNFLKRMLPNLKDEKIRGLLALNRKTRPEPYVFGLIKLWEAMALMDYRLDLETIDLPVAIFRGEFSFYSKKSALYLKNKLKGGRIVEFKSCSHQLILEDPRGFEREIQYFIEREGLERNDG